MSDLISINPEVMSGAPCIAGRRIPVTGILECFLRNEGTQIVQKFGWDYLSPEQILAAIHYAIDQLEDSTDLRLDLESQLSAAIARAETAQAQRDEAAGHLAECLRFLKIFTTRKEAVSKPESFLSRLASGDWKPDPRLALTPEKLTQIAEAVVDAASFDATEERMDSYEQRCFLSQELESIIAALEPDIAVPVFSRDECIFNYCPNPEACAEKCISPSRPAEPAGSGGENE